MQRRRGRVIKRHRGRRLGEQLEEKLEEVAVEEAKDELTDYTVYQRLASNQKSPKAHEAFQRLSEMENTHFEFWKRLSGRSDFKPKGATVAFVLFLRIILGSSFVIKYLERRERSTASKYERLRPSIPKDELPYFERMIEDEKGHEVAFATELEGSYVRYISFIVLGLADALVEIAGIHAGSLGIYTRTELAGLAGIIAGAAASLAMASAAYAQAKQGFQGSAAVAAAYTGVSYFVAAVTLALPYFLTRVMLNAITLSVALGIVIIAFVSWYNSVMSGGGFRRDFSELAGIMLGATLALYLFGTLMRAIFGITI